jgi:hypothetical protein
MECGPSQAPAGAVSLGARGGELGHSPVRPQYLPNDDDRGLCRNLNGPNRGPPTRAIRVFLQQSGGRLSAGGFE